MCVRARSVCLTPPWDKRREWLLIAREALTQHLHLQRHEAQKNPHVNPDLVWPQVIDLTYSASMSSFTEENATEMETKEYGKGSTLHLAQSGVSHEHTRYCNSTSQSHLFCQKTRPCHPRGTGRMCSPIPTRQAAVALGRMALMEPTPTTSPARAGICLKAQLLSGEAMYAFGMWVLVCVSKSIEIYLSFFFFNLKI